MEELSYLPSDHSSDHVVECSQMWLRPVGSQMSISSAGSVPPTLRTKRRSKVFGGYSHRGKRTKRVARKLNYSKAESQNLSPETVEPMPSFVEQMNPEPDSSSSNVVMNLAIFKQVLDSMAKCSRCNGRLELVETGTSSGCASYLSMKCSNCESAKKFWSVGGYSHGKLTIGSVEIPKRNSMVYCSVLGGRLMGIGWQKLFLYHSMLNIPGPVTSRNFGVVQENITVASEATAIECMVNARDELRSIMHTDPTLDYVSTVGTFDGATSSDRGNRAADFHGIVLRRPSSLRLAKLYLMTSAAIVAHSAPVSITGTL